MTDGDRKFLARLVASHKAVISEECRRKNLDKSEYFRRVARADTKRLRKLSNRACDLASSSQTFCAVYLHRNHVKPSKLKNYGENDTERVEETR